MDKYTALAIFTYRLPPGVEREIFEYLITTPPTPKGLDSTTACALLDSLERWIYNCGLRSIDRLDVEHWESMCWFNYTMIMYHTAFNHQWKHQIGIQIADFIPVDELQQWVRWKIQEMIEDRNIKHKS